jgi:hypothetical protein
LPKPVTSEISGATWAVKGDTASFSVVPGMVGSMFNWTLTGGSVQSGSGSSNVVIQFNSVNSSVINVQENASNGCKGAIKTININLVNTGLNNLALGDMLKLYPNPANEIMVLDFALAKHGNYSYAVYNSMGQKVQVEEVLGASNTGSKMLQVAHLPEGIYIIRITQLGKEYKQTFVKN